MASNSIAEMQNAIIRYINSKIPKDKNNAVTGIVHGNKVIVGKDTYPYIPAVDMYFGDGDHVACILPNDRNVAAVVGVC